MKKIFILAMAAMLPFMSFAQDLDTQLRKLVMATALINNLYVDTVDTKKLVEDAIQGMLSKQDPHSTYANASDTQKMNEQLQGSFEGIGIQFNILEDTLMVIQTITKGPSEKVGILAGDRIVTVNDTTIAGVNMSRETIMSKLRGPKGSKVKLGVKREGIKDLNYFTVTRDKIPTKTVDAAYMVTPTIGLVRFSSFGFQTHDEVMDAIKMLKAKGMKNLILDLQQNGGGLLGAAADIASEFLQRGDTIVYTKGRSTQPQTFISAGAPGFQSGKVAVLIDEYSASAAEIVTGALQDQDRGIVVGRRSFGKGLVQRPIDLPDGSMIRLTVAHYYTPSGRCIQKPYVKGKQTEYAMDAVNRLKSGELTNIDSIHFADSLKYTTRKLGRTVYGGGGIMPDYFVPLDTTRFTRFYREMSAKSLIIQHSLKFVSKNHKKLNKEWPDFEGFKANYETSDEQIKQLFSEAEKKGITPKDDEEKQQTVAQCKLMLKALVARDIWDMSEYFSIIYDDDPIVQKAVELLSK